MSTSIRATRCLVALVALYLATAIVAGARASPLTVLLPPGSKPPSWSTEVAEGAGLDRLGRDGLTGVAWVLVLLLLSVFAILLREAWIGRLGLGPAFIASGISLAIVVAAPLLLSRDVYTYAAYGRIEAIDHRNPYVVPLWAFRRDPFVAVSSAQWHHGHSLYGPLFTLMSAGIARVGRHSVGGTLLAFKLLAGSAVAAATGFAALATRRIRPDRAALAVALVGLNPVIVVHTVGGAHVDALISALLAAAAAIAVTRPRPSSAGALGVTLLLTLSCLIKSVIVPLLVLWLYRIARERAPAFGAHLALVAAPTLATVAPFVAGRHTLSPFVTLGGLEAWASPPHLAASGAQALVGGGAAHVVEAVFLVFFCFLALRLARGGPESWGAVLLLLALSLPYLLPWYVAWSAPLLALLADGTLLLAGVLTSGVLALTLIPADPFYGRSSTAVLDGVHYGAGGALLIVLAIAAARVLVPTAQQPPPSASESSW